MELFQELNQKHMLKERNFKSGDHLLQSAKILGRIVVELDGENWNHERTLTFRGVLPLPGDDGSGPSSREVCCVSPYAPPPRVP